MPVVEKLSDVLVTAAQLRAARGLLDLTIEQVSGATKVSSRTIRRAEHSKGPLQINAANAVLLATYFETHGVEFLAPTEDGSEGVRLKRRPPAARKRKTDS